MSISIFLQHIPPNKTMLNGPQRTGHKKKRTRARTRRSVASLSLSPTAMATPCVLVARTVFAVLGLFMLATLIYTLLTDGSPFRRELFTPWMIATLIDFYINVVAISVWVIYKEQSMIHTIVWIVFLVCFGSITTCTYVVLQLSHISSQYPGEDPSYQSVHLPEKKVRIAKQWQSPVQLWRVVFILLGCLMLGTLIYTLINDGSPFRLELLTPWMITTLIDFYINVAAIGLWVVHKEQNWISAVLWIVLLVCFGSVATCAYIVKKLFDISADDPLELMLFVPHDKQVRSSTSG